MKRKRLLWSLVITVAIATAVFLSLWRRHTENSFGSIRTPDSSEAWMKAAEAEAAGDVVIAIGSFDHRSVNNRSPGFPDNLASHLLSYREPRLSFVQRKIGSVATPPANWILNGAYDTAPDGATQVHLTLVRIRGGQKTTNVSGELGADLNQKIAEAIKQIVHSPDPNLARWSGRVTEAQLHLDRGRELSGFDQPYSLLILINRYQADISDRDEVARQKFRLGQAVRSLESSLALEPERAETKLLLGACFETSFLNRRNEARRLYQEVIDSAASEEWRHKAKARLTLSWQQSDPDKAIALLRQFEKEARSPKDAAWFRDRIDFSTGAPENNFAAGKEKLIEALDRFAVKLKNTNTTFIFLEKAPPVVFSAITNDAAAAAKTLEYIEELRPKYPGLVPYLIRDSLTFRIGEQPVIQAAFKAMVAELKTAPGKVARPDVFYGEAFERAALSLFKDNEDIGGEAVSLVEIAHARSLCAAPSPRLNIARGFQLMKAEKWREALAVFESVGDRIVAMETAGPWGCGWQCPTSPMALADQCRLRLGVTSPRPGFHQELRTARIESPEPPAIALDRDTVWVAHANGFAQFNGDGNEVRKVKFSFRRPATSIVATTDSLYVGTEGAGLVQVAKDSMHWTDQLSAEDLSSAHITALELVGDALWIGFGQQTFDRRKYWGNQQINGQSDFAKDASGGIGVLDLKRGRFTDYPFSRTVQSESLNAARDFPVNENESRRFDNLPPNRPVLNIAAAPGGDIYLAVDERGIQRFEPAQNRWTTLRNNPEAPVTAIAASEDFLCVGQMDGRVSNSVHRGKSIWIRRAGEDAFKFFTAKEGLPHENVTALLLDKQTLWIGGFGFVAQLSLNDLKINRIFSLPAREVSKLLKSGENLWISTEDAVYIARL